MGVASSGGADGHDELVNVWVRSARCGREERSASHLRGTTGGWSRVRVVVTESVSVGGVFEVRT